MIRIFVGCASGDDIESQAVLEYTLRKHASENLEIVWMAQSRDPASPFFGWRTERWSTPFSGFRWAVPELCGFDGKAIYLDSDIICMADIAELWRQPLEPGKFVLAKGGEDGWRFCVSVWDCAVARPHVLPIEKLKQFDAHQAMTARMRISRSVQAFDGAWNVIDCENFSSVSDPRIKMIHYSAENCQPHLKYAVPRLAAEGRKHWFDGKTKQHWRADLVTLFDDLLPQAKAAGFDPVNYEPALPFGTYKIQSHIGYQSHRWAR